MNKYPIREIPYSEDHLGAPSPEVIARRWGRFMEFVSIDHVTGCWNWKGSKRGLYGRFYVRQVRCRKFYMSAHRFAYVANRGPLMDGFVLDHLCRNTLCVNADHTEQVTIKENTMRGLAPSARFAVATHCKHGHPFSGRNLRMHKYKYGLRRVCVTCHKNSKLKSKNT